VCYIIPVRGKDIEMTDKMRSTVLVILSTFLLLASFALAGDEDKVLGLWDTPEKDCKIEILKCGDKYCGRIT
jgi:uncharacterized protein (DUF2147 family)